MVQLVRHPQTKERDTDRLHLNHRATSRLYCLRDSRKKSDRFFGTLAATDIDNTLLASVTSTELS